VIEQFNVYRLAVKYWLKGDSWEGAVALATHIVKGWRKPSERK